jgi:uncharacterized repeat protein (TIGR03806 family)
MPGSATPFVLAARLPAAQLLAARLLAARLLAARLLAGLLLPALASCSSTDSTRLFDPRAGDPGPRPEAFLQFPPDARQAPRPEGEVPADFPRLLSETGAFRDVRALQPSPGLVPYDLQAPLWSDGATKTRWMSLPELGSVVTSSDAPWAVPPGTVFVKHFEMALDERRPEVRRRLETRLLVAAPSGSFYGVTYKWNAAETDAELLLAPQTEPLGIVDAEGTEREQPYYYPGPRDCIACHTSSAGYVLGLRTRQLNYELDYAVEQGSDGLPFNQLLAWSAWGFLDRTFNDEDVAAAPRLSNLGDERSSLETRVRSYWDSNCSLCHAGSEGSVLGWDARFFTPFEEQGLDQAPRMFTPGAPSVLLAPGNPEGSYVYVRSVAVEEGLRMPPIGRNRVDEAYVDVLARWIDSL